MRLIDADKIGLTDFEIISCNGNYKAALRILINKINEAPTIDAAPVVHGVWITKEYMYGDPDVGLEAMWIDRIAEATDYYAECSVCGKNAGYDGEGSLILSDFCPSCGAKMRGGADNA